MSASQGHPKVAMASDSRYPKRQDSSTLANFVCDQHRVR